MKSLTEKLFTSPTGSGFFESPGFFFGIGAGLVIFALHGAVTGQFAIGPFVIAHAVKPGFFVFMLVAILVLGTIALYRGYRRWRAHDG